MDDISADVVQEGLVVGDDQQSLLPVLQVIVQPDNSVQIKMIGRFIK